MNHVFIHGPHAGAQMLVKAGDVQTPDFGDSGQRGGNEVSSPNGLARESLNLRSMDSGGYVDMSLYRWIDMPICRNIGISWIHGSDLMNQNQ